MFTSIKRDWGGRRGRWRRSSREVSECGGAESFVGGDNRQIETHRCGKRGEETGI